jgi:predicted ABC-type ATPase
MDTPPQAVIIAGPNGAGKTTAAKALLTPEVVFVNADLIAQRLTGRADAPGEVEAMRIEIELIDELVRRRESFAMETTLAPRSLAKRIRLWQSSGYETQLLFLCLPSTDLAISRVLGRVAGGGHHVPEEVVRRRFGEGLRNFFNLYSPLVRTWRLYDGTSPEPRLIAEGSYGKVASVNDEAAWSKVRKDYAS